jgi:hypothetical protein
MEPGMTHEEHRELEILSAAEVYPTVRMHYSFKTDPELAATARRLGMVPVPNFIHVSESPMPGGPTVYLIKIRETGRVRLRALRVKLAAEQR